MKTDKYQANTERNPTNIEDIELFGFQTALLVYEEGIIMIPLRTLDGIVYNAYSIENKILPSSIYADTIILQEMPTPKEVMVKTKYLINLRIRETLEERQLERISEALTEIYKERGHIFDYILILEIICMQINNIYINFKTIEADIFIIEFLKGWREYQKLNNV